MWGLPTAMARRHDHPLDPTDPRSAPRLVCVEVHVTIVSFTVKIQTAAFNDKQIRDIQERPQIMMPALVAWLSPVMTTESRPAWMEGVELADIKAVS